MIEIDVDYLGLLDDIKIINDQELSRDALAKTFQEFARDVIREEAPKGYSVDSAGRVRDARGRFAKVTINQREALLRQAEIQDTIEVSFVDPTEMLQFIGRTLETFSPVGPTGRYRRSHRLYADGREIDFDGDIPPADQYVFVNTVPYARKIERGMSSQAPEGVYQVTAALARRQFSDVARNISYSFYPTIGGERNPAIIVVM